MNQIEKMIKREKRWMNDFYYHFICILRYIFICCLRFDFFFSYQKIKTYYSIKYFVFFFFTFCLLVKLSQFLNVLLFSKWHERWCAVIRRTLKISDYINQYKKDFLNQVYLFSVDILWLCISGLYLHKSLATTTLCQD